MNKLYQLPFALLMMILVASLSACHDDDDDEEDDGSVIGNISYEFSMLNINDSFRDVFNVGDTIRFKYSVSNDSNQEKNFTFSNGLPLEISIYEGTDTNCSSVLVWTYSKEFDSVTLPPNELYLDTNETQDFIVEWDQQGNNNSAVGVGEYCLDIQLNGVSGSTGQFSDDFRIE